MKVNIGKDIVLDVDVTRFGFAPESELSDVATHIIYLGLRNPLMDSHAGMTKDEGGDDYVAKSRAIAERKLEAMYAGTIRVAGTREGDPVRAEAKKLAVKHIESLIKKGGEKVSDYDRKDIVAKAMSIIDRFMETAQKNIDAAKAIVVDDIDLPAKKSA